MADMSAHHQSLFADDTPSRKLLNVLRAAADTAHGVKVNWKEVRKYAKKFAIPYALTLGFWYVVAEFVSQAVTAI